MKIDIETLSLATKLVKRILKSKSTILDGSNNTEQLIEDVLDIIIKAPDILSLKEDAQIAAIKTSLLNRDM